MPDGDIYYQVFNYHAKRPEFFVNRLDKGIEILLYFNEKGTYDLLVVMNTIGIGLITFNCDEEPLNKKYYPIIEYHYLYSDTKLISPIKGDLTKGQKYNFELISNEHKQIKIIMDDEYINMTKTGNIFKEDNLYIHSDNIIIKNEKNNVLVSFKGIGDNVVDYPKIEYSVRNYNVRLIQPSTRNLYKGQTYEFKLRNYNDGGLFIFIDGEIGRIDMDKNDNNIYTKTLKIETTVTSTKLRISYLNRDPEYSTPLFEYTLIQYEISLYNYFNNKIFLNS